MTVADPGLSGTFGNPKRLALFCPTKKHATPLNKNGMGFEISRPTPVICRDNPSPAIVEHVVLEPSIIISAFKPDRPSGVFVEGSMNVVKEAASEDGALVLFVNSGDFISIVGAMCASDGWFGEGKLTEEKAQRHQSGYSGLH
jgi:hypothetical protein